MMTAQQGDERTTFLAAAGELTYFCYCMREEERKRMRERKRIKEGHRMKINKKYQYQ